MNDVNLKSKPKVLLLGSTGQLGQAIKQHCTEQALLLTELLTKQLDYLRIVQDLPVLSTIKPDIIINCAAYTAVDLAEQQHTACWQINHMAVAHLANYCRANNVLFIHFSTDYVFNGRKSSPYIEADLPDPLNQYGASKLAGEQAIVASGCRYIIIRTSWLYSQYGKNFYRTLQQLAHNGQPISVVTDQIGTPTHADELAGVVHTILRHAHRKTALKPGVYHYAGRKSQSWYQFAQDIMPTLHNPVPVLPITTADYIRQQQRRTAALQNAANPYECAAIRPANSALNSDKLRAWLATVATQPCTKRNE